MNSVSAELANYLRGREAVCPLCATSLRDWTGSHCPGCRRELCLTVGLAEPYVRAWVAMAAALCAMAGIGMWIFLMICNDGWPKRETGLFQMSVVVFLVSIPLAILGIARRKVILRMGRGTQAVLAVSACVLLVVALGMFFSGVR